MASLQEPGLVRIIAKKPTGEETELYSGSVTVTAPGGGSPDGAGSATPKINERLFVPVHRAILRNDDIIFIEFTSVGADTLDITAMLWDIPLTTVNGVKHITISDFADPALAAVALTAGIPVRVAGFKVTEGALQFGGGPLYLDFQDDT